MWTAAPMRRRSCILLPSPMAPPNPKDFRARRGALKISPNTKSAGIGLPASDIVSIEAGIFDRRLRERESRLLRLLAGQPRAADKRAARRKVEPRPRRQSFQVKGKV